MLSLYVKYQQKTLSNFLIEGSTNPVDLVEELCKHFSLESPANYCLVDLSGKRITGDSPVSLEIRDGDMLELSLRPEALGRKQAELLLGDLENTEHILKEIIEALPSPEFYADFSHFGGVRAIFSCLSMEYSNLVLERACIAVEYLNEFYNVPLEASFFQLLCIDERIDEGVVIASTRILIKLAPFALDHEFNESLVQRYFYAPKFQNFQ